MANILANIRNNSPASIWLISAVTNIFNIIGITGSYRNITEITRISSIAATFTKISASYGPADISGTNRISGTIASYSGISNTARNSSNTTITAGNRITLSFGR